MATRNRPPTQHGRKAAARSPSFFRNAGSRNKINRYSMSLASFTAATAMLPVVRQQNNGF
jgi:hypothetical protein